MRVSLALLVGGVACVAVGVALLSVPIALICLGAGAVGFGLVREL